MHTRLIMFCWAIVKFVGGRSVHFSPCHEGPASLKGHNHNAWRPKGNKGMIYTQPEVAFPSPKSQQYWKGSSKWHSHRWKGSWPMGKQWCTYGSCWRNYDLSFTRRKTKLEDWVHCWQRKRKGHWTNLNHWRWPICMDDNRYSKNRAKDSITSSICFQMSQAGLSKKEEVMRRKKTNGQVEAGKLL